MLQLLDELLSMLTVTEIPTGMIPFFGPALALQSQALLLLGRSDEAERVFLQAIDMLTQMA
jgi:hypothetical protein